MTIILLLFLFIVPLIVLFLDKNNSIINKIGTITTCYILGILISLTNLNYDKALFETIISIAIILAIPLMLFDINLRKFISLSKKTLISFLLMICSVIMTSLLFAVIGNKLNIKNSLIMSSMATGLYVGGTQNLFAIGKILTTNSIISLAHIADTVFGGVYLIFVSTVGIKLYSKILKDKTLSKTENINKTTNEKLNVIGLLKAFLLSLLCLSVGVLIEYAINKNIDGILYIVLTVSVLAILLSNIKSVRNVKESYALSEYFILVFSLGLGMSIDFSIITKEVFLFIVYFGGIQTISISIHFILCKIFKIEGGTALITSIAAIYGPPFVATIGKAYKKDEIIAPGLVCGTVGLALGNFIGLLFYYICKGFIK